MERNKCKCRGLRAFSRFAERCEACGTTCPWWRIIWLNLQALYYGHRFSLTLVPLRRVFSPDAGGSPSPT